MCVYLCGCIGDLIFISPHKKSLSTFLQSIFRFRVSKYSHVAISLDQYNAIHSSPIVGVKQDIIHGLLNNTKYDFSVFRNKSIQENEPLLIDLRNSLLYHTSQGYNYAFFIKSPWHSSFCSELAVRAFRLVGIKISNHSPQNTLPVDIYKYVLEAPDWIDITDYYKKDYLGDSYYKVYDKAAEFMMKVESLNQNMSFSQKLMLDKLNYVTKDSESPTNYSPARDYWTNLLGERFSLRFFSKNYLRRLFGRTKNK